MSRRGGDIWAPKKKKKKKSIIFNGLRNNFTHGTEQKLPNYVKQIACLL